MKNLFGTVLITLLLITGTQVFSQEIKLESGNLAYLKGQTQLHVEYDYSQMAVGDYPKEADYIKFKTDEANKKKAGSGDKWLALWNGDKTKVFQPEFEKVLKKKTKLTANGSVNSQYTLIVQVTFLEPGFYVSGFVQKRAELAITFLLVDSKDHNMILAKLVTEKMKSKDSEYDLAGRLKGSYTKAAQLIGEQIAKARKKK